MIVFIVPFVYFSVIVFLVHEKFIRKESRLSSVRSLPELLFIASCYFLFTLLKLM